MAVEEVAVSPTTDAMHSAHHPEAQKAKGLRSQPGVRGGKRDLFVSGVTAQNPVPHRLDLADSPENPEESRSHTPGGMSVRIQFGVLIHHSNQFGVPFEIILDMPHPPH